MIVLVMQVSAANVLRSSQSLTAIKLASTLNYPFSGRCISETQQQETRCCLLFHCS